MVKSSYVTFCTRVFSSNVELIVWRRSPLRLLYGCPWILALLGFHWFTCAEIPEEVSAKHGYSGETKSPFELSKSFWTFILEMPCLDNGLPSLLAFTYLFFCFLNEIMLVTDICLYTSLMRHAVVLAEVSNGQTLLKSLWVDVLKNNVFVVFSEPSASTSCFMAPTHLLLVKLHSTNVLHFYQWKHPLYVLSNFLDRLLLPGIHYESQYGSLIFLLTF